jgi:hypothetical protein
MNCVPTTALLIDADDTLWENNIYFEQVREQFLQWMEALGFGSGDVQDAFTEIEHRNIHKNGCGGENFIAPLKDPVAQTELCAVCGFSSPNWPKAADLPEKREVCATRLLK